MIIFNIFSSQNKFFLRGNIWLDFQTNFSNFLFKTVLWCFFLTITYRTMVISYWIRPCDRSQNTPRILKIRTEYSKYTQNTQNTHRILKIRTEYSKYTQNTQSTQRIPNKRSICSLQISKLALNKLHEGYSPKNSNLELCTIQYDLGRVFNASGFYLRATASPVNSLYKSLQFRAISWNSAQLRAIQEQLRAIPHSCAQRNCD